MKAVGQVNVTTLEDDGLEGGETVEGMEAKEVAGHAGGVTVTRVTWESGPG